VATKVCAGICLASPTFSSVREEVGWGYWRFAFSRIVGTVVFGKGRFAHACEEGEKVMTSSLRGFHDQLGGQVLGLFQAHPWLLPLRVSREYGGWHHGESTAEHVLGVIQNARRLLAHELRWLDEKLRSELVGGVSRAELFALGVALHDVAKPYTQLVRSPLTATAEHPVGTSSYPGHEAAGADLIPVILGSGGEGYTPKQVANVAHLVRYHGEPHVLFGLPDRQFRVGLRAFRARHRRYAVLLLALAWADTIGSREAQTNPKAYERRLRRYAVATARPRRQHT
jgi:HD domain